MGKISKNNSKRADYLFLLSKGMPIDEIAKHMVLHPHRVKPKNLDGGTIRAYHYAGYDDYEISKVLSEQTNQTVLAEDVLDIRERMGIA